MNDMRLIQPSGSSRGNRYAWNGKTGQFEFYDTGEAVGFGYWNQRRECAECGKVPTPEGHDACLGTLPGVKWACCGHGGREEAYVVLEDGTHLRGNLAIKKFEEIRRDANGI